ncbi:hypothetical protein ElyMa_002706800 [Elysia marginata]|uniref:Uncharacterized protein n=1 Tax=Elysia marginata TaxID=1093978 RepID=A0AAV4HEQ9_9GAST|nr:hypothetical protein ElyMa_002706800 [Elysia marginata]
MSEESVKDILKKQMLDITKDPNHAQPTLEATGTREKVEHVAFAMSGDDHHDPDPEISCWSGRASDTVSLFQLKRNPVKTWTFTVLWFFFPQVFNLALKRGGVFCSRSLQALGLSS